MRENKKGLHCLSTKGGKIVFRTTKEQMIGGKNKQWLCPKCRARAGKLQCSPLIALTKITRCNFATTGRVDSLRETSPSVDSSRFKPGRRFPAESKRAVASEDGAGTLHKKRFGSRRRTQRLAADRLLGVRQQCVSGRERETMATSREHLGLN